MVINMCEYNNVPKIRFKGFTDVWEQRKLGDECFELIAGGDIDKTRSVNNGKYPIYANALTNDGIVGYYNDSYRVKSPAVTITGRGEIGYAMARNTDFTPVVRLISLRSKHNNYFLANTINLLNVVSESTGVPQLTIPQVEKFDIYFPKNINEEIKLGRLFNEIDNLITLHQRKCDNLINVKKSLLEKMFPKNSSNIPEIRFKGFTDVWEQRKLKELGDILTGLTPSTQHEEYYSQNGMLWVTPTDIDSNIIKNTAKKLSDEGIKVARIVPANTILVTCIASIGKNALILEKSSFNQQINSLTPYKEYNPYFLLTESSVWSKKMKQQGASGMMQMVNKNEFSELETFVPKTKEQDKIGELFINLDNLITLHQRKLEKLKNIKKSMLEKMFV